MNINVTVVSVLPNSTYNFYKPPTRFAVVKTDCGLSMFLQDPSPTRFAVVKMDSPNLYWPPTHFMMVKDGSRYFHIV